MRTDARKTPIGIWPVLLLVLVCQTTAQANPCIEHPTRIAAWIVVVLAALALEVFVTTGFLLFAGLAVVPTAIALTLINAASYLGIVLPLWSSQERLARRSRRPPGRNGPDQIAEPVRVIPAGHLHQPEMAVRIPGRPGRQRLLLLRRHPPGRLLEWLTRQNQMDRIILDNQRDLFGGGDSSFPEETSEILSQ